MAQRSGQVGNVFKRLHLTLVLAGVVGVLTGIAVAAFEFSVSHVLEWVLSQRTLILMTVPAIGLVAVAVLTRVVGDSDTTTTDAYVRAYHRPGGRLYPRSAINKVIGSAITIGSGNAFGFEGPSMLIGGTIGSSVRNRFGLRAGDHDAKVLMVAGAAAGVGAVFKAPLTGLIFALEVPYHSDIARRALLPALTASATAYLTYVSIVGVSPLIATGGTSPFDFSDLVWGLALGVVCGVLARLGAWLLELGKSTTLPLAQRVGIAAAVMIVLAPLAIHFVGGPEHMGPSYRVIEWAMDPSTGLKVLIIVFAMRAVATWAGVFGGGMGGLFIPLVTQGAVVGSIFQRLVDAPNPYLFPTIGISALLGSGYNTPLAGVAFAAEATGQPGFLVPALLATVVARLIVGGQSFSSYQLLERPG